MDLGLVVGSTRIGFTRYWGRHLVGPWDAHSLCKPLTPPNGQGNLKSRNEAVKVAMMPLGELN